MKTITHIVLFCTLILSSQILGQDDSSSSTSTDDCWCLHQSLGTGGASLSVRNVDSLSINANPDDPYWRLVEECADGEGCESTECIYERKTCRNVGGERICTWHPYTGACSLGDLGEGTTPWDTTGVTPSDECNCISIPDPSDISQVYLNINDMQDRYPDRYIIMEECSDDECEGSCQYLKITQGNSELLEGFCTQYWPEDTVISSPPIGLKSNIFSNQNKLFLFPNPANSQLFLNLIKSEFEVVELKILDINGRLIDTRETTEAKNKVSLHGIPPGVYFVQAAFENGVFRERLIVE